jgi:hypothetical protein
MRPFLAMLFSFVFPLIVRADDFSKLPPETLLERYAQLRTAMLDPGRVAVVENVALKKDRATFHLTSGNLYFLSAIGEKTVGAAFIGKGRLELQAPADIEKRQIARFNDGKSDVNETFQGALFFFTDSTYTELEKQVRIQPGAVPPRAAGMLKDFRDRMRDKVRYNVEARMLADLCYPPQGSFDVDLRTDKHGPMIFSMDPLDQEDITLTAYRPEEADDPWTSFASANRRDMQQVDTEKIALDVTIERGEKIAGTAEIEFVATETGPRMLRLRLAHTLRLLKITDSAGAELKFIQEDKKKDANAWVILKEPLQKGDRHKLSVTYTGDEVIHNAGGGNYSVGLRVSWYPSIESHAAGFGDRAMYRLKFKVPKDFNLVATGRKIGESKDNRYAISEWESEVPYQVIGFNYGRYTMKSQKDDKIEVNVYANPGLNSELREIQLLAENNPGIARELGISGSFDTTSMAQRAASVAFQSMRVFTHYFGEIPFKTVSVTQQPAGFFGQAWPTLVFLPYTAFLDSTIRHQLKLSESAQARQFYEDVGPHEIAHQWWGHTVGWKSYRDQWLSEGFAQFSAALFTHLTQGQKKFQEFMNLERGGIIEKTHFGYRPTDIGPITMGYRLNAKNADDVYSRVVYSKGGYVVHMLRMIMRDWRKNSDERFIAMMRDFVKTHYIREASTEDFQAMVSKHFGADMSWFFKQWVYGTAVPKISIKYQLIPGESGKTLFKGDIGMANIPADFRVVMPFSLRFGKDVGTGLLRATGPSTPFQIELPQKPDGVEFNSLNAVLCELEVSAR